MNIQKITITITIFSILAGAIGYFSYTVWEAQVALNSKEEIVLLSEEQIADNRKQIISTLTDDAGVSMKNALRGFWYRYIDQDGIEQIALIDPSKLAERDITKWQISNIGKVVSKSEVIPKDNMEFVPFDELPNEYQFHNALYSPDKTDSFIKGKKALEVLISSKKYTSDDLFRLGYIYELEGKYSARDNLNIKNCMEFKERCSKGITIEVTGTVVDLDGSPIQSALVELISQKNISTQTNVDGEYTLIVPVRKMEKLRIKAHKRNYSDGIVSNVVISKARKKYKMAPLVLASPLKIVTINTIQKTATGEENSFENGAFTIKTTQSTYTIPENAIVYKNGKAYRGQIEIYLYEFTQDTAPESLLAVDTMDSVMGYAGDLMKSFGMPYIQFFTPQGEELHVFKTHPMSLKYKIYHMDALFSGAANIYEPLTQGDMSKLVEDSQYGTYPIGRDYLIENQMLQFPAFWVFDREAGIWENVGINVLTTEGLIESPFYTLNDSR